MLSFQHRKLAKELLTEQRYGALLVDLEWPIVLEKSVNEQDMIELRRRRYHGSPFAALAKFYGVRKARLKILFNEGARCIPGVTATLREVLEDALNEGRMTEPRWMHRLMAHLEFLYQVGDLDLPVNLGSSHQGWYVVGGQKILFKSKLEAKAALYFQRQKEQGIVTAWVHQPEALHFQGITWAPDFLVKKADGTECYYAVCVSKTETWEKIVAEMHRWMGPESVQCLLLSWFKENEVLLDSLWDNLLWVKKRMLV